MQCRVRQTRASEACLEKQYPTFLSRKFFVRRKLLPGNIWGFVPLTPCIVDDEENEVKTIRKNSFILSFSITLSYDLRAHITFVILILSFGAPHMNPHMTFLSFSIVVEKRRLTTFSILPLVVT